jgi:iron complex outermembrane receptor protein
LYSYELGLKTDLFNKRVRLNASAFYYDIVDPQVQLINSQTGSIFYSNAERAAVKGGEIEAQALVSEGFIARLSASGLDSRYKSYEDAPSAPPIFVPPYGATSPSLSIDATGNYTPQAPKWTADAGFDYTITDWMVSADYFYNSGFFWEPDNILRQKSYSLINAQFKYSVTKDLAVRLWGKNLASAEYASRAGTQGGTAGYPFLAAPPRTYGIAFDFKL